MRSRPPTPNPYEWHELTPAPREEWLRGPIKHIRLLADANVHEGVALYLKEQGLPVETVKELGSHRHADENVYQLAKRRGRVILTNDADLWNDRKHPLQGCPGVLFLDVGHKDVDGNVRALLRFEYFLYRNSTPDWWRDTKVRVIEFGMTVRCRLTCGQIAETECRHL